MNDPFRVYLKVKVKEGQMDSFLQSAADVVETVKSSEPEELQFEVFANNETLEAVWLQSYKHASSFDFHLTNSGLKELHGKMMQSQESLETMYFMSEPSEERGASMKKTGINAISLSPWPGTLRLTESRNDNNIQSLVTMELADMAAYRKISEQIEEAAINQPGVLFHRSYQMSEKDAVVFEEYKNSSSLLNWVPVFGENSGDFASLVQRMTYEVYGTPSYECKTVLDGWGAIYFARHAGFVRFN